jgi:hypothetical protein
VSELGVAERTSPSVLLLLEVEVKDREARGEEMEWWWVDVAAMVAIK